MGLAVNIYRITQKFPEEEKYNLTSQIRRAANSISANIAEGSGRNSEKEFNNFLGIASGSCSELISHINLAYQLSLINAEELKNLEKQIEYIQNMNFKLKKSLTENRRN